MSDLDDAVKASLAARKGAQLQAHMRLIGHLDPDAGKPCRIKAHPLARACGDAATYVIRCRFCSFRWLSCNKHTSYYRLLDSDLAVMEVSCTHCYATARHIDALAEFIPIGPRP